MRRVLAVTLVALVAATSASAAPLKCAADAVKAGNACVDKYEASIWSIDPIANKSLVKKVQSGKATLDDLTEAGATQLSPSNSCTPAYPMNFPANGNWTPVAGSSPPSPGVYAVSIPGVRPSTCITWFQAEQACAVSGKRLASNQEWQRAAAGTPDGAPCVVSAMAAASTGANAGCLSQWGAYDMVGNVWEWVGGWVDKGNNSCAFWPAAFGGDVSCVGGSGSAFSNLPGALIRGGSWGDAATAGVFAVIGLHQPSDTDGAIGFRCAR